MEGNKKIASVYARVLEICKKGNITFQDLYKASSNSSNDESNEGSSDSDNESMRSSSTQISCRSGKRSKTNSDEEKKKKQRTGKVVNKEGKGNQIDTRNRFEIFSKQIDMEECEELNITPNNSDALKQITEALKEPINKNRSPKTKKHNNDDTRRSNSNTNTKPKSRIPPIMAESGLNSMVLTNLLKRDKVENFEIKILKNKQKVIKCDSMESHKIICASLKKYNVGGHTYTPKHEKPVTLLARGIHHDVCNEEIEKEIEERYNLKTKVKQFNTPRSAREKRKLDIKIISFENNTRTSEILKIKYLFYHKIQWEHLKKKEIVQCLNCLKFGHIARNCFNQTRCIKCMEKHGRGECKRKSNKDNEEQTSDLDGEVYCVNCSQRGHPANYKGCPVYIKAIETRRKISEAKIRAKQQGIETDQFAQKSMRNLIQKGVSFASVVQAREPQAKQSMESTNWMEFLQDETNNMFGMSLVQTMTKVREFMGTYRKIQVREEKQMALITFLMDLCQN